MQRGFSLLELLITLIILGILSVTVIPRLFSNQSEQLIGAKDSVIAVLRLAQSQTMQCTHPNSSVCQGVTLFINANSLGSTASCNNDAQHFCNSAVSITTSPSVSNLQFTAYGQPTLAQKITLTLNVAGETKTVCIESQGYIHSC